MTNNWIPSPWKIWKWNVNQRPLAGNDGELMAAFSFKFSRSLLSSFGWQVWNNEKLDRVQLTGQLDDVQIQSHEPVGRKIFSSFRESKQHAPASPLLIISYYHLKIFIKLNELYHVDIAQSVFISVGCWCVWWRTKLPSGLAASQSILLQGDSFVLLSYGIYFIEVCRYLEVMWMGWRAKWLLGRKPEDYARPQTAVWCPSTPQLTI